MSSIRHWLSEHEEIWFWVGGVSILLFVVSLALLPWIVSKIPVDYFCADRKTLPQNRQSITRRLAFALLKNVVGIVLVILGVVMLFVPGQGILTIAIGIMLMSFPGKRSLEIWLIRRKKIYALVNWLRAKKDQPPIEKP